MCAGVCHMYMGNGVCVCVCVCVSEYCMCECVCMRFPSTCNLERWVCGVVVAFLCCTYFHVDLQPPWTQQGLINHILPVGHPNDQDIVQLLNSIHLNTHTCISTKQ